MKRIFLALILLSGATACATDGHGSVEGKHTLVIGVKADQPGLGLRRDGRFTGFDIDVADYIARKLGASKVEFVGLTSADRERFLDERRVDLVVASYSITPLRKTLVRFAGPYYVAHQDTLVRSGENGVRGVRDLKGRRLCAAKGSNSSLRVTEEREVKAVPVEAASYSQCIDKLVSGQLDAVSTDDIILAGFATDRAGKVKLVNAPFTDEKMGIGLNKDDIGGCEAVNRAITSMYQDGTAAQALTRWFGKAGLKITTTVPQFEGCH
ncbi:MAG: glutamate ABC transporter substrate-binding protein [Streptosporangiaceae bacterium]